MKRLPLLLLLLIAAFTAWRLMAEPPQGLEPSLEPAEESVATVEAAPAVESVVAPLQREGMQREATPPVEPEVVIEEEPDFMTEPPPDPIQVGSSSLELTLLDSRTKENVSGTVQLWRLKAPGNEGWHTGDQLQHQAAAVDGLFRADRLPEGEYRIYALFAKDDAESGPVFRVEGLRTALTQEVEMPQEEELSLILYHFNGIQVLGNAAEAITWCGGGNRSETEFDLEPEWLDRRWPREDAVFEYTSMGGGWSGGHHKTWAPLKPAYPGFALGSRSQDGRGVHTHHRFLFRKEEGRSMAVRIRAQGSGTYLGLFVAPEEVARRLVFPPGEPYRDLTRAISIEVEALPLPSEGGGAGKSEQELLLDVPVRITISTPGLAPFRHTWRMRDGDLPEMRLQLAEPK